LGEFGELVGDFGNFDKEINQCEKALSEIDSVMSKFQNSLTGESIKIYFYSCLIDYLDRVSLLHDPFCLLVDETDGYVAWKEVVIRIRQLSVIKQESILNDFFSLMLFDIIVQASRTRSSSCRGTR